MDRHPEARSSQLGAIRQHQLRRRELRSRRHFEGLVEEALASLPEELRRAVVNVAVTIQEWPSAEQIEELRLRGRHDLFGLYEGTPLDERAADYGLVPPDKITIFRQPLLRASRLDADIVREVRATVLHELGHYFGMSDAELEASGL